MGRLLSGWAGFGRAQTRGLAVDTIKARCRLVSRFVEFTNESMNPIARRPQATTTVKLQAHLTFAKENAAHLGISQ